jgi:hypothetical protein
MRVKKHRGKLFVTVDFEKGGPGAKIKARGKLSNLGKGAGANKSTELGGLKKLRKKKCAHCCLCGGCGR